MGVIDIEPLLEAVSADAPSGDDLEYDPEFLEMARAAERRPEQQMGDSVVEAQEPDWRVVRARATGLLARTKDLRVGVYMTRALLQVEGIEAAADGIALIRGMIERFWDTVHPQLDADDDNDPTMRINALVGLTDAETLIAELRRAPLVRSRGFGQFSLRDIDIATGVSSAPESGPQPPGADAIDGAFFDADLDELQATATALGRAIEDVGAIESKMTEHVGVGRAADLAALPRMLRGMRQAIAERLERRGADVAPSHDGGESPADRGRAASAPAAAGEIRSREDVVRMLEKACEYFERNEPSSPVPLLLRRAKRLISKDFMEILKDLAPDGVSQAENVGGTSGGQ